MGKQEQRLFWRIQLEGNPIWEEARLKIADLRAELEQAYKGGEGFWGRATARQMQRAEKAEARVRELEAKLEQAEEHARQGWAESHANAQTAADAIIGREQAQRQLAEAANEYDRLYSAAPYDAEGVAWRQRAERAEADLRHAEELLAIANKQVVLTHDLRMQAESRVRELEEALRGIIGNTRHTPMCGCDHEQNDPSCHVGIARAALQKATDV